MKKHNKNSNFLFLIIGCIFIILFIIYFYIKQHTLQNWTNNASRYFSEIHKPKNYNELISIVSKMKPKTPIIVNSSSYSWSPYLFTKGTFTNTTENQNTTPICITTTEYKGEIIINDDKQTVTCLSGTYLGELLHFLGLHKYTLNQFPNIPFVTVGGAIATCTHGCSLKVGTMSELVTEMYYVLPGFKEEKKVPYNLLGAYAGSIGQLGIITKITLKITPTFWLHLNKQNISISKLINDIDNLCNTSDYLAGVWTPNTNEFELRQYTKIHDTADKPISLFECKINNKFMVYQHEQSMNGIYDAPVMDYQIGISRHTLNEEGLVGWGQCEKQYSVPTGNPEYIEVEYTFDIKYLKKAFNVVNDWVNNYDAKMELGVFIRFSGNDTLPWLSNARASKQNVWFLIDVNKNSKFDDNFKVLEKNMWEKVKARPHLGKWNNIDNSMFVEMYGDDGKQFLQLKN
jgi:L-gulonolactone oxidase